MPELTRLDDIRRRRPLLHCISNIVTANDCANIALALGASPMMAEAPEEMADIARIADAEVLNTGTPSRAKFDACLIAGREGSRQGKPVVLDPVGVGASPWRLAEAGRLLEAFRPCILRVNLSEARALLGLAGREKGVDSAGNADRQTRAAVAAELASTYGCVVLLSGEEDIVAGSNRAAAIIGGSPLTPLVTGTGCMLSVLCGAFAAVEPNAFDAALMASVFWKACSERAEHVSGGAGPGALRAALMDSAHVLVPDSPCFEGRIQAI